MRNGSSTPTARGRTGLAIATAIVGFFAVGCEEKEKVLDIETPEGGVEIERSRNGDELEFQVEPKGRE